MSTINKIKIENNIYDIEDTSKATIEDMTKYIEEHKEELKGADGVDGKDGKDGANGKDGSNGQDGYSPIATVTQTETGATITITDKNGTTTTNITNGKDGKDGVDGANGEKGDTPVKGTDYWTDEDKEEIVGAVVGKAEFIPTYASTVDDMTDTSKLYLGSNGNIWAYTEKLTENKVNQYVDDKAKYDVRLHPSYVGTENEPWRVCKGLVYVEIDGIDLTNKTSYIIRFSGVTVARHSAMGITGQVVFLDQSSSTQWDLTGYTSATYTDSTGKFVFKQDDNGYYIDLMDANPSADTKRIFFGICVADNTSVSSTDCENLFVECVPFTTYTPEYNWNDTGITYANYAMTDADTTAIADKLYNYKVVYVDGDAGNDANKGSQDSPMKSIQTAINSGAKTIYCKPGIYNEALQMNNIHDVKIIGGWEDYVSGSRPKVRIDHSETLEPVDNGNGLKTIDLPSDSYKYQYPLLYNVFVTNAYAPTSGSGVNIAYTVSIWNEGDGSVSSHYKLVPVMTLEECQNTAESFFYDGTTLYFNSTESTFKIVATTKRNKIENCSGIIFEDIVFDYTYFDAITVNNSNDIVFRNCEFSHSSTANGIALNYTNGELYNCEAYRNRNDGFNFHYFGDTTIYNCIGAYNYDDGISHHESCTGSIHGGQYHHNGKGGVASPTYGAVVDIYNVVMNDNKYGIYAYGGTANREIIVNGCYIHHNTYGVGTQYDLLVINSVIKDNTTNTSTKDNATITVVPTI